MSSFTKPLQSHLLAIFSRSANFEFDKEALFNPDQIAQNKNFFYKLGAIYRGDITEKKLALIFTGDEFGDGGDSIRAILVKKNIKAGFFFTGNFYRNPKFKKLIAGLKNDGHYLGPHSDTHLLYCPWDNRDSTQISKDQFVADLLANFKQMAKFGIQRENAPYFIPPYEWYNQQIADWTKELGLILFNFTPGTSSNADYTTPDDHNYLTSEKILKNIVTYEKSDPHGLNGFLLLLHIGTHSDRTNKFYFKLEELLNFLEKKGYKIVRVDELL